MSAYTHNICPPCYQQLYPGREPVEMKDKWVEKCCWCGQQTGAGIFVRYDPRELDCEHTEAGAAMSEMQHHIEGDHRTILVGINLSDEDIHRWLHSAASEHTADHTHEE